MSDNQNMQDYGQQFKIELEQALGSGDFSRLNQLVADTVGMAVSGAAEQVTRATDYISKEMEQAASASKNRYEQEIERQRQRDREYQRSREKRSKYDFRTEKTAPRAQAYAQQTHERTVNPAAGKNEIKTVPVRAALMKKTGNVSGTLLQVFGGIGTGLFGISSLVFLIMYILMQYGPMLALAVVFFAMTIGSIVMLGNGGKIKARLGRAQRYFELCHKSGYMNISQIAEQTGRKEKAVVRELKKLIENGTFPQGHLDKQQKCFMLTDTAYAQYQEVDRQRQQYIADNKAQEQIKQQEAKATAASQEGLTEEQKQLNAMIAEGNAYIRQIREKNDVIPGEVISQKLFRMEALLKEIFANLERMPQQMSKMQRLMHYYLPTTLKLVTAYEQFDRLSVQGEDVLAAKREIENTIDTINNAFGELLNKLFADTAMDVTADAQVLKTMLAKEGLVEGELEHVR